MSNSRDGDERDNWRIFNGLEVAVLNITGIRFGTTIDEDHEYLKRVFNE